MCPFLLPPLLQNLLVEVQLPHKALIRVNKLPVDPDIIESVVRVHSMVFHQVGDAHSGRPGDAGVAVD
jgi:hypothetical protein